MVIFLSYLMLNIDLLSETKDKWCPWCPFSASYGVLVKMTSDNFWFFVSYFKWTVWMVYLAVLVFTGKLPPSDVETIARSHDHNSRLV